MILVFIYVLIFILLLITILASSTLKINIDKITINNKTKSKNIKAYIQLYFLNKIKIAQIEISKDKLKKIPINKIKKELNKMDIQEIKNDKFEKQEIKRALKALNIKLEKLKLQMNIGTEDVLLTTVIVAILSAGIGLLLPHIIKTYEEDKYYYEIIPSYNNTNEIKLNFECIIYTKMVHIIYVIYILIKMRRVKKNERTSNRRTYDYSYE